MTIRNDNTLHVLSWGMGVESTAILLRWLFEPECRPASLENIVVISAHTGNEFPSTRRLVEEHIFPLLRQFGVRYVQVARQGPRQSDGYIVLDDTRRPSRLYSEGYYSLGRDLLDSGTVLAYTAVHHCAMKFKGFPLDSFVADYLHPTPLVQYLGYNFDEVRRADKSIEYSSRTKEGGLRFPLIEMGWDRAQCQAYIEEKLGVPFERSACVFCPFAERQAIAERYLREPEAAASVLFLEYVAVCLNPRMALFPHGSAYDICVETGNTEALSLLDERLSTVSWAMYKVDRIWTKKTSAKSGKPFVRVDRRVRAVEHGDRFEMEDRVRSLCGTRAAVLEITGGVVRAIEHRRVEGYDESFEGFWVAAPAVVFDKVRNANAFDALWQRLTGAVKQLQLLV